MNVKPIKFGETVSDTKWLTCNADAAEIAVTALAVLSLTKAEVTATNVLVALVHKLKSRLIAFRSAGVMVTV